MCWSPNYGWVRWEGKTVHNLSDGGWHGDKIETRFFLAKFRPAVLM